MQKHQLNCTGVSIIKAIIYLCNGNPNSYKHSLGVDKRSEKKGCVGEESLNETLYTIGVNTFSWVPIYQDLIWYGMIKRNSTITCTDILLGSQTGTKSVALKDMRSGRVARWQGSFLLWAGPIKVGVTWERLLSLTGPIPRLIPGCPL